MDTLFLSILNMSLTGAFVIAAICLARLPLKKAPKAISYALWTVAGFRLVFPFSIESLFSLIPFSATPIPADIAMQPIPRIDIGIPFVNNAVSSVLPAATSQYGANPLQIWIGVGAYVWLIGVAIMLIYGVLSFVILKMKMSGAAHASANIYEADNIKSPFVLGIFAPKIYLPVGLSEHERGYILLHEQTHIRRRDHIVKIAAYFILCLHWFNPLAWLAFLLMGADMEMSCDERVMKEYGGDICDDYSMSLVRIATGRRTLSGSPLAFGEGGMKERVKRVLNFKKPSRIILIAAIALVAILSVGFAVNRVVNEPLIEMQVVHEENPAHFFRDMKLIWNDNVYHVTPMANAQRGRQIGFASDEHSTWRIYELRGHGRDFLFAAESDDVWRVMSVNPPEQPWRQYILENATESDRLERMLSVSLYSDGTAQLATPPISSFAMVGTFYYSFTDSDLLILDGDNTEIARFEVVDENTIIFRSANVPLFATEGARYVTSHAVTQEILDKIDLGMTSAKVYELFGEQDFHAFEVEAPGENIEFLFADGLNIWIERYSASIGEVQITPHTVILTGFQRQHRHPTPGDAMLSLSSLQIRIKMADGAVVDVKRGETSVNFDTREFVEVMDIDAEFIDLDSVIAIEIDGEVVAFR